MNSFTESNVNTDQSPNLDPGQNSFGLDSPKNQKIKKETNKTVPKSDNTARWVRLGVLLFSIIFLIIGRTTVPDHNVLCIVDRLMDALAGVNEYVVSSPFLRNFMLITCSLFMDITFVTTGFYWIFYGNTSRIMVALPIFYIIRASVQQMWYSPYPSGYYWDYPGFPSLVVPYGRSTDFYFSGHIGFVVLNASEWYKNKKFWAAALVGLGGVYTVFVLLVFQAHYSIDIFTGIICASLVFIVVDMYKEKFDGLFSNIFLLMMKLSTIVFKCDCKNGIKENLLSKQKESQYTTESGSVL